MATQLFSHDGQTIYVEPHQIKTHLERGWRLDPDEPYTHEPKDQDPDMPDDPVADMGAAITVAQIREMARDRGIDKWDSKRVKTLKVEMGIE